jgi:signal transduction histidine kinase
VTQRGIGDVEAEAGARVTGARAVSTLGKILMTRSAEVVRRWSERIAAARGPDDGTPAQIVDDVPAFLATLADAVDGRAEGDGAAVARTHGRQRFRMGFDLALLVAEYGYLQDVLLEMLAEEGPGIPAAEVRVLCRQITAALGAAVGEYAALREHQRRDAQERLRADALALAGDSRRKDDFLAVLGHELRNPLAPIATAAEMMAIRAPEVHREERLVIERQVRHMSRLVDDLLDVSRIASGSIGLQRALVELSELVRAALEVAEPFLLERQQEVRVEAAERGLAVRADEVRMTQVISNLLINAARFSEPGGRITVRGSSNGDLVRLDVIDEGRGIPRELLPRIFGMFVQGGRSRDELSAGLGLGLTIAKSLTELHGGTITAHSEGEGRGSRFTVELPAASGASAHAQRGSPAASAPAPDAQDILVVDDNRDAANLLAEALRALGHRVEVAYDGPSALAVAARSPPTVAILDIGMPVMDGYQLARHLRSMSGLETLRLASISGFTGLARGGGDGEAAVFDEHFAKPVPLATVAAWVRSAPANR